MTHLRKMMLEELQRRHYSEATTQRFIRFIERFAQHFHCSPDRIKWANCATGFLWRTWLFLYILPWWVAAAGRLGN